MEFRLIKFNTNQHTHIIVIFIVANEEVQRNYEYKV